MIVFGGYLGWLLIETQKYLYRWVIGFDRDTNINSLAIGIYILIIFLFWNGVVVMKKESRSFGQPFDSLVRSRFDYLLILDYTLVRWFHNGQMPLFAVIPFIFAYLLIVFFNFYDCFNFVSVPTVQGITKIISLFSALA